MDRLHAHMQNVLDSHPDFERIEANTYRIKGQENNVFRHVENDIFMTTQHERITGQNLINMLEKDKPLLPTDNWTLYFYQLSARGLGYHLDDNPQEIFPTLDDATMQTMITMDSRFHETKQSIANAWELYYSRPCTACESTTFIDNDKCSECA